MISKFKIAGGKEIKVENPEYVNNGAKFGEFNDASNIIQVANKVKIDNDEFIQTEEDKERTLWHEIFHCFQFYAGMEDDEKIAQTFSNFIYEYLHTNK